MTAPPNGGNCTIRGATRRRHADGRFLMVQTPTITPGVMLPHRCRTARRAPINACGKSPAMTRGRQAASSQATLVADEALHPIGKIQPQLIRCNPPNGVGSHRRCKRASTMTDDASARHGQPHRRRASASAADTSPADTSPDNAWGRAATNTLCPLTQTIARLLASCLAVPSDEGSGRW